MPDNKEGIYQYQPLWGKWYIDLPIGKGSFGTVYKITREELGSKYTSAVKIITVPSEEQYREAKASLGNDEDTLNGFFEDVVKNIVNEINVLYSLGGNPNIISYQDHEMIKKKETAEWDILIRMEYVTSLSKYLENNMLRREQVIRLGMDICTALEACSKKGIIHRDIKDENIFINEDGIFKLGDFGIAKELSKSGRAASMRGTPLYMAPEVFKGEKYDAAVDIYSLGILLYKLLNYGRMPLMPQYPQPISFKDSENALERRVSGEPLPIPALAGDKLGAAVLKACAYRPEERYTSATEMKRTMEQVLASMSKIEREEIATPAKSRRIAEKVEENEVVAESQDILEAGGTLGIFETANPSSGALLETQIIDTMETKQVNERTIGMFEKPGKEQSEYQQQAPAYGRSNVTSVNDANTEVRESSDKKRVGTFAIIGFLVIACITAIILISQGKRNDYVSNITPETSTEISMPVATSLPPSYASTSTEQPTEQLSAPYNIVAAGYRHTVAVKYDGSVCAIGLNDYEQCNTTSQNGFSNIVSVAAGGRFTIALKQDGTLVATGDNSSGSCNTKESNGFSQIIKVVACNGQTIALKQDGTVISVGLNKNGQCNTTYANGFYDIVDIAAGDRHTVALRKDGTVIAIGDNTNGQCNTTVENGFYDVVSIAAGWGHTVALRNDGTVVAVGHNKYGRCDTTTENGFINVVAISSCGGHTVALRNDGTVVAIGENLAGQCNTTADKGFTNVTAIFTGADYTIAIRNDGSIVSTGDNSKGQLNFGDDFSELAQIN